MPGGLTSTPHAGHPTARPRRHTCPVTCARRGPALLGKRPWACEGHTCCRNTSVWSRARTNSGFSPLASGAILWCSGFIFSSKSLRKQVCLALPSSPGPTRVLASPCVQQLVNTATASAPAPSWGCLLPPRDLPRVSSWAGAEGRLPPHHP